MFYGQIDFIYGKGEVGETIYYTDKKKYDKEIKDSCEIGRPIDAKEITRKQYLKGLETSVDWDLER